MGIIVKNFVFVNIKSYDELFLVILANILRNYLNKAMAYLEPYMDFREKEKALKRGLISIDYLEVGTSESCAGLPTVGSVKCKLA